MLVESVIRARSRSLMNELVEGFFFDDEFNSWISDAAIDISSKSFCYMEHDTITLVNTAETYDLPLETLKIISVSYDGVGLERITSAMKGKQTAVPTGKPKYFYEMIGQIGLNPVPGTYETSPLKLYVAKVTSSIVNIPTKFQAPAIFFVTTMALIKQKQYDKAIQLYNLYLSSLGLDRQDIVTPQTELPPPQNQYTLRIIAPNQ